MAATANGTMTTLEHARRYLRAGLSIIPIARDGSKRSIIRWKEFETRRPTDQEIESFFNHDDPPGIAIIGGDVSGGVEVLDFDEDAPRVFSHWCTLVEAENQELTSKLTVIETPRGGVHA